MDWTNLPVDFVAPTTTPEQQARWAAVWEEARQASVELVSDDEKESVRNLIENAVPYETPRGWALQFEEVGKRDWARGEPTEERVRRFANRFHSTIGLLRDEAERDPNFFPSPVGQELLRIFDLAMLYSVGEASLGYSVREPMTKVVWPTLWMMIRSVDAVTLPQIVRQFGTVPFEIWADRFRRSVSDVLEGWYRPMVSAFYRLSRLPAVGQTPPDVAQIGKLFRQAQDYWGAGSPLSLLVDRRIAIVRNSEAHKHTDLDLRSERFTFISKDPAGVEKDRWSASPADFQRLAVHCFHLGELMRTVLMVVAFRSAGPETLVEALTHLWKRPTPEAD